MPFITCHIVSIVGQGEVSETHSQSSLASMVMGSVSSKGKFEGIGNVLMVPENSSYDSACFLKSDVSGVKTKI